MIAIQINTPKEDYSFYCDNDEKESIKWLDSFSVFEKDPPSRDNIETGNIKSSIIVEFFPKEKKMNFCIDWIPFSLDRTDFMGRNITVQIVGSNIQYNDNSLHDENYSDNQRCAFFARSLMCIFTKGMKYYGEQISKVFSESFFVPFEKEQKTSIETRRIVEDRLLGQKLSTLLCPEDFVDGDFEKLEKNFGVVAPLNKETSICWYSTIMSLIKGDVSDLDKYIFILTYKSLSHENDEKINNLVLLNKDYDWKLMALSAQCEGKRTFALKKKRMTKSPLVATIVISLLVIMLVLLLPKLKNSSESNNPNGEIECEDSLKISPQDSLYHSETDSLPKGECKDSMSFPGDTTQVQLLNKK